MQGTSDAVASRNGMLVSEVTVLSRMIVFDCVTLTRRTVLLARLLPTRACRSARLAQLESILLPVQQRAQTAQRARFLSAALASVHCARQARITPTRRPPLSLLAQLAPPVRTATASVPPPAQHAFNAPLEHSAYLVPLNAHGVSQVHTAYRLVPRLQPPALSYDSIIMMIFAPL